MKEILKVRMADMLLIEVMEASHLIEMAKSATIDIEQFCKISGKTKRRVYKLVNNKLLPEEMIIGGYDNRKRNNKLMFDTEKVLKWLKS